MLCCQSRHKVSIHEGSSSAIALGGSKSGCQRKQKWFLWSVTGKLAIFKQIPANWIQAFKIQFPCLSHCNPFAFSRTVKPEQYPLVLFSRRSQHPVLQEGRLANLHRRQKAGCRLWMDLCPEWKDRQNRECIFGRHLHHSFPHKTF